MLVGTLMMMMIDINPDGDDDHDVDDVDNDDYDLYYSWWWWPWGFWFPFCQNIVQSLMIIIAILEIMTCDDDDGYDGDDGYDDDKRKRQTLEVPEFWAFLLDPGIPMM